MTPNDLQAFKKRVRDAITHHGIRIYTPPIENDDAQAAEHAKSLIVSRAGCPFRDEDHIECR